MTTRSSWCIAVPMPFWPRSRFWARSWSTAIPVAPINPICRRNPSIPGLCRIASPTCARPFRIVLAMVREAFLSRAALHLENLALRQQLAALDRKGARPSLRMADRLFWVVLSRLWSGWREILVIVKPETVIGWHRKGFRRFWTRKSRRGKPGRPPVPSEVRGLIRRMSRENPLWGAPRIHGELRMLGYDVSEAAVSKYMPRHPKGIISQSAEGPRPSAFSTNVPNG